LLNRTLPADAAGIIRSPCRLQPLVRHLLAWRFLPQSTLARVLRVR